MKKLISILFATLGATAGASPRIDSDSIAARHDMLLLRDSTGIESAVLTWPWPQGRTAPTAAFESAGENARHEAAAKHFAIAYDEASELGLRPLEASVALASDSLPFRSYGYQPREQFEASISQSWLSEWFAGNISLTLADDASDGDDFRLDGSYLAVALGNWSFGIDQVDRWWGPGWDGSLILSNNARPVPALSLTRISPDAFESKWLRWIGPWTFTTFMGQLDNDEGDRPGSDARLFGMRIDFSPFGWENLDIGLSRTGQWAGDGRPGNFNTFWRLLRGIDNEGGDKEPGNQLAGVDYRLRIPGWNIAQYGQVIGEDEDSFLPDANMLLGGIESWGELPTLNATLRVYFEWADTRAGYLLADPDSGHRRNRVFNTAYNHGIYQSGYRRKGQAIGHAMDGDSVMRSLGAFILQENGNLWGAKIRNYSLNRDGRGPNSVTIDPVEGQSFELFAELSKNPNFFSPSTQHPEPSTHYKLHLGLHYIDEENQVAGTSDSDFGGHAALSTSF